MGVFTTLTLLLMKDLKTFYRRRVALIAECILIFLFVPLLWFVFYKLDHDWLPNLHDGTINYKPIGNGPQPINGSIYTPLWMEIKEYVFIFLLLFSSIILVERIFFRQLFVILLKASVLKWSFWMLSITILISESGRKEVQRCQSWISIRIDFAL